MARASLFELHAMVAVSTHRSFRAAASALGSSPSALSHGIATLEQRLGIRLFNRTTRSVSLSRAGEQFLGRIRPALQEISDAMEGVNAFRDKPIGTLRLNTFEGAAFEILTPIVVEFVRRYPEMQVELATNNRLVDIVAEGFDAGVRLAEAVPRDMVAVACGPPQRLAVVASPKYLKRRPPPETPADLLAHNCIRWRTPWSFARRGEDSTVEVRGSLLLDNYLLMIEAALQGVGVGCVSEQSVAQHLAKGRLKRLLADWTPPYPGLRLYYPSRHYVPAGLRAFVDVVREVTRKSPAVSAAL